MQAPFSQHVALVFVAILVSSVPAAARLGGADDTLQQIEAEVPLLPDPGSWPVGYGTIHLYP